MIPYEPLWYKDAIIYELHVKAFADSNADGVGDFMGLIGKLDYLQELGITCIWLLPFYPSPLRDDGYDIENYHDVHPDYGTREQFLQFIQEAHADIRVITELVINHTSDQHPWFRAARMSPPGSPEREFYVWSDTDTKYAEARIIFTDTESSNWTWDPLAKAYYWHRFFQHQPDLNFDNPEVLAAVLEAMRFWLDMGVDGLRIDAIPYLIEREGTDCENLSETHAVIKQIRKALDAAYPDKLLLAEANQWPADVLPYFGEGDGDECHMAFHFPLMPRIYMALRQEDRHPIVEIMRQTPEIPPDCQWAIFLRNHDELTLEMVTDEERDYMNREYAADPRMRINVGIRRRLAPLIQNSRLRIELLNSLLLSFPGTPVIYYGDEIGMGDNIYLGDRNGVRTPMQWNGDRNGGFSRADFAQLYAPPIMDPVYGYNAINVEAQLREPTSLLQWMRRIIALRRRYKAFGRGTMEFLRPANGKILAYLRKFEDETILCVANLSRFVQPVELDLSPYEGHIPVELFGNVPFPEVRSQPYFLSTGASSFLWFKLERALPVTAVIGPGHALDVPSPTQQEDLPTLKLPANWATLMEGKTRALLERLVLPRYLSRQRWFQSRSRTLETLSIRDWVTVIAAPEPAFLMLVRVYFSDGTSDRYNVPIGIATGVLAEQLLLERTETVLAFVEGRTDAGVVYDAVASDAFCYQLLGWIDKAGLVPSRTSLIAGVRTLAYEASTTGDHLTGPISRGSTEQAHTTIVLDQRYLLKLFRRLDIGISPEFEVGRFLTERTGFSRVPKTLGALEIRRSRYEPASLALLQSFVPNQGRGWEYIVGVLGRFFEQIASEQHRLERIETPSNSPFDLAGKEAPADVFEVVGAALRSAGVLGKRTGEMHLALSSDPTDPAFVPEPLTPEELAATASRIRDHMRRSLGLLRSSLDSLGEQDRALADRLLNEEPEIAARVKQLSNGQENSIKMRIHGDYHLGQILWVENDFVILNLEDEPGRSMAERRAKKSPLSDVVDMIRSFDYAVSSSMLIFMHNHQKTLEQLEPWAQTWRLWISATFLEQYRLTVSPAGLLPAGLAATRRLFDIYTLEKSFLELQYELKYRPEWVSIPIMGILRLGNPS